jgi:hypothetical protein
LVLVKKKGKKAWNGSVGPSVAERDLVSDKTQKRKIGPNEVSQSCWCVVERKIEVKDEKEEVSLASFARRHYVSMCIFVCKSKMVFPSRIYTSLALPSRLPTPSFAYPSLHFAS